MGVKTRAFLKNGNRDFNNIIDTIPSVKDDFTVVSATGDTDLSSLSVVGTHTVLISVALADDNFIRLQGPFNDEYISGSYIVKFLIPIY